jgi:hypothetical protein
VTTRKRRPPQPDYRPGQVLDWTSSSHWDYSGPSPCRYCGADTHLRDSHGKPADKVCAEKALDQQHAEAAAAYGGQTL